MHKRVGGERSRGTWGGFFAVALVVAMVLNLLVGVSTVGAQGQTDDPFYLGPPIDLNVASFVLLDVDSGQILAQRDATKQIGPASLAKLMTLELAFDAIDAGQLSLDDEARVSEKAWRTGGSKMFVLVDTTVTIRDLLYGIAVSSGNDAAIVLAEHMAGSEDAFVQRMNQRAQELGMTQTTFKTAHGLPTEGQVTTALDMATLARAFVTQHPSALELMSTTTFTYQAPGADHPITQYNRNHLLTTYEGANGLKTGHTGPSGFHLIASAKRDGMFLIGVVMGAPGDTETEGFSNREQAAAALLDYGFGNFRTRQLDWTQVAVTSLRVWKGKQNEVAFEATEPTTVTYRTGQEDQLDINVDVPESMDAPIQKGSKLGTLTISQGDTVLRQFDLVASDTVERGGFFKVFFDSLRRFFARLFGR